MVVRQPAKPGLRLQMSETVTSGVATSGQGIRVVDAQNGATTEEGAFALSRPLQAGAFNYTLNRDSDEDWYLRSENAYRAEVPPVCLHADTGNGL